MTEYNDDMRGALFANRTKKSEKSPDLTGKCEIEGVKYRIAAWKRASNNTGQAFFSLSFESEEEAEERRQAIIEQPDDALDL